MTVRSVVDKSDEEYISIGWKKGDVVCEWFVGDNLASSTFSAEAVRLVSVLEKE